MSLLSFYGFCSLLMCDDPTIHQASHDAMSKYLDQKAQELGFKDWIEAFHKMELTKNDLNISIQIG